LKLVWQPPLQLLAALSSLAILPCTEFGSTDGVCAVDDPVDNLWRDPPVFARCFGADGLATCFGASTVTVGSEGAGAVAVCAVAGPHSKIVDTTATTEGATTLDDNLMTMFSPGGHAALICMHVYVCTLLSIAEIAAFGD
jgi:hypothetical protein